MSKTIKIAVVSGGFDPIHSGHIAYLKAAKQLGDILIVALNSDEWLIKKKGKYFMPFLERKIIIENFSMVTKKLENFFGTSQYILLQGDICRSELLIEIEGISNA